MHDYREFENPPHGHRIDITPYPDLKPPGPSVGGEQAADDQSMRKTYNVPQDAMMIYTDGACPSNGLVAGRAGIGVFFGLHDPRNISARLPGVHQTNQRAELFAVLKALEILHTGQTRPKKCVILTDSKYVVQALTQWAPNWERKGWKTADRKEVVSKDLFKRARDLMKTLAANGTNVEFRHIRGHSGVWGNEMADKLAVEGAWMEEIVLVEWEGVFDDEELDRMIAEMENV